MLIKAFIVLGALQLNGAAATPPLGITATIRQQDFKVGGDVQVWLSLANVSEKQISYIDRDRECDYSVQVRNLGSGNVLPMLEKVKERCARSGSEMTTRNIRVVIAPGQAVRDRISLNEMVDLSKPGDYAARILRPLPALLPQSAISNEIEFHITR